MSDLFSYLNCDGPEYSYLGHFRTADYLYEGHNDLGLEQQIDAGNIPDLHSAGKNIPAEAEPGNIASQGSQGSYEGQGKAPTMAPPSTPRSAGGEAIAKAAGGGVGSALAGIFGI